MASEQEQQLAVALVRERVAGVELGRTPAESLPHRCDSARARPLGLATLRSSKATLSRRAGLEKRMRVLAIALMMVGAVSLCSPPESDAGPLLNHPDAYDGCAWLAANKCSGTFLFDTNFGHSGFIEYAVF